MHAEHRGQLVDLHDLFLRRPVFERVLDMNAQARFVEVRCRHIDGNVDEFLHLRLEPALPPGNRGKFQVRREEIGIELQEPVPELVPVAAVLFEGRL